MKEQGILKERIQECELKLERAQKLTEGLSEEKIRWRNDITVLEKKMNLLPGDTIISAGMVAYSGPFTSTFRLKMEREWLDKLKAVELAHTEDINMRGFLG
jgi:dynein heavy chain